MHGRIAGIAFATIALAACAFSASAEPVATQPSTPDPWEPIRFMAGEWVGTAEGQAGKGTVHRTCSFVLKNRYLYEMNTSTYPPQEANKAGEIHEHWSMFSYDRLRKILVLRQFHTPR